MPQGSFGVWPADATGKAINYAEGATPNPHDAAALDLYIGPDPKAPQPPPKDQLELLGNVQKVLRTIQLLYGQKPDRSERDKAQFRVYYVRLFELARLGLSGASAATEVAKDAIATVAADLIDDETGRVKNNHLIELARVAGPLAIIALVLYVVLRSIGPNDFFERLRIDSALLANFTLLWAGCFLGVWLSYAIRTTAFTLRDLVITDSDRLLPGIRLAYAGFLTMIIGMLFAMQVVDIQLGGFKLTAIQGYPMLAFVVGTLCGISELTLSTKVAKRASDFINSVT